MSSPHKDTAAGGSSRMLSEQDAVDGGDGSNPHSRRASSSRPGVDRALSANTIAALRDQFEQYGSPPKIPNIPLRASASATEDATPAQTATPETAATDSNKDTQRLDAVSHALATSPSRDGTGKTSAAALASGSSTPAQSGNNATSIEELTDAQKAMIVGRHLVDKQGQQKARRQSHGHAQESKNGIADMLKNVLFKSKKEDDEERPEQEATGTAESGPSTGNPQDFPVSEYYYISSSWDPSSIEGLPNVRFANHVTFFRRSFSRCHSDFKAGM